MRSDHGNAELRRRFGKASEDAAPDNCERSLFLARRIDIEFGGTVAVRP